MIDVGDAFPDFELQDANGNFVTLQSLIGCRAVLFFYPKDDTPGCTREAQEFRDLFDRFQGSTVYGVSPDSAKSHRKFIEKYGLPFGLLVDEGHRLAEACGIWVEKTLYGKKYMGVERTTYLLDEQGLVTQVWRKVEVDGHAGIVAQSCYRS